MGDLDIVGIRDAGESDQAFVMDSWLSSFRGSHFAGPISMVRYRDVYRAEIADLVLRPNCHLRCAYNKEATDQIFAFICFERGASSPIIHFAYVKKPFRRRGIFALLAKDAGINTRRKFVYTYRTRMASELAKAGGRFERAKFDPFEARYNSNERNIERYNEAEKD